jgi:hypothetical protein
VAKKKVKQKTDKKVEKKVVKGKKEKKVKEKKPVLYRWGKVPPGPWVWKRYKVESNLTPAEEQPWLCGLFAATDEKNPAADTMILYLREDLAAFPYAGKLPAHSLIRTAPELAVGCEESVKLFKKIAKQTKDKKLQAAINKLVSKLDGFLKKAATFDDTVETLERVKEELQVQQTGQ